MKIAVNTRLLINNKLDGIGWFSHETLKRITTNHKEHQFYFIFDRVYSENFIYSSNITPIVAYPQARHPYLWYLFFEYGIPQKLKKIKPDLFLSTDGWVPLKAKCDVVNVIHDLNFEHFPEFIKPKTRNYYNKYFHQFAKKSTRIATVSNYTKDDINKLYSIPLDIIDVVYNGSNSCYKPLDDIQKENIKKEYTNGNDYFLFVGTIHKRKNLDNIFRAFDKFKKENNNNIKFVVVGNKKWWAGDIEDSYNNMEFKDDVIFLGRLDEEELAKIYASSIALVYASLFEGFGIPIIEAFNAETAVITSNVTSMPEVAGDAALLVNPLDVDEIANSLKSLAYNKELRDSLIEKGKIRKLLFSWDKTAEKLWNTIEKVLEKQ